MFSQGQLWFALFFVIVFPRGPSKDLHRKVSRNLNLCRLENKQKANGSGVWEFLGIYNRTATKHPEQ